MPASVQILLLLSAGVGLYVGIFHFGVGAQHAASRWLGWWGLTSVAYVVARYVQLEAATPESAAVAAHFGAAMTPLLLWTVLRFVSELAEAPPARSRRLAFAALNLGLCGAILATDWFVAKEAMLRPGLFGEAYYGAVGRPGMLGLALYIALALAWVWRRLARTHSLTQDERRTLTVCLTLYAALGATSVLASAQLIPGPGLAELGPLVVSIGASKLAANRELRLKSDLAALVHRHTTALRESEERYRNLIENAPIGVMMCDRAGRVVTATRRFREILDAGDTYLLPGTDLLTAHPGARRWSADPIREALETGEVVADDQEFVTWRGRRIDLRGIVAPHRDASGEIQGVLILLEDVTERRALESRLRQSHKMEAIGQLAVGIAQGIASPIESLRAGLAKMRADWHALRESLGPPDADEPAARPLGEIEELLDESCEGAERAAAIVRDMSDFARGGSPASEPVDLNALLRGVVRMAATHQRGAERISEHYGEIPPVVASAGQLRQVFLNLVVNGLQASGEHGHVSVETTREGAGVRVRVSDDGTGIAPENRERLFVPFFTTKPAGEGTGLGLFISYQVVQRHGGEIRVTSTPGAGASFDVWIPLAPPARPQDVAA